MAVPSFTYNSFCTQLEAIKAAATLAAQTAQNEARLASRPAAADGTANSGTGELRQAGQKKAQITFPFRHFFPLKVVK
jgi:hypothetical protein